jgi:hypothetical protein
MGKILYYELSDLSLLDLNQGSIQLKVSTIVVILYSMYLNGIALYTYYVYILHCTKFI